MTMSTMRTTLSLASVFLGGVVLSQACSANTNTSGSATTSESATATGGSTGVGFTGAGGAEPGTGGSATCAETSAVANEGTLPADIVFLVDNSGSMTDEAKAVQASMNDFSTILTMSGIDYHVILISEGSGDPQGVCVPAPLGSGKCVGDEKLPTFRHVFENVGSNSGLEQLLSTYPKWKDSLRPNASRTIAIITDDDSNLSAAEFTKKLLALDPSFAGFKFDGIFAPHEVDPLKCASCTLLNLPCASCDPCCGKDTFVNLLCTALPAAEGKVYKELTAQTMGVQGSLCQQEFKPVFLDIAKAVVNGAKVPCVYAIPAAPNNETIDFGKVNVDYKGDANTPATSILYVPEGKAGCDANGGWYYDNPSSPKAIHLCEASCIDVQKTTTGKVNVKFGCATVAK